MVYFISYEQFIQLKMSIHYLKYRMIIIFYSIIFVTIIQAASNRFEIPRLSCDESTNQVRPYPKICNIYYECKKGQMQIRACNPSLNFNSQLGVCDHTVQKNCLTAENQEQKMKFCPPLYVGQIPDPDDCRKYIVCYFGTYRYEVCKSGFVYNVLISSCDQLENVPECSENKTRNSTTIRRNYDYHTFLTKNQDNEENDTTIHDTTYIQFMNQLFTSLRLQKTNTTIIQLDKLAPVASTTTVPIIQRSGYNLKNMWTKHWGPYY